MTAEPETPLSIPEIAMRGYSGFVKWGDDRSDEGLKRRRLARGITEAIRESESVSSRQRGETRRGSIPQALRGFRGARAQAHDAAGQGEKVFHPVAHLSQQQVLSFARLPQLRDVARDFRSADNLPA